MTKTPAKQKLTIKQEAFALKYVECGNASEAYRHAYNAENCKPETVWRKAVEVLENGKVAARVQELQAVASEKLMKVHNVTVDRVLDEYARIGFSDIRKVLSAKGNPMDPQDWDDDTAGAIAGLEIVVKPGSGGDDSELEYVHKFKMWDKKGALDSMAKHLGMFDGRRDEDPREDERHTPMDDRAAARRVAHLLLRATS